MSNQFKRLDDLKELAKDLPDGEKLELIKNELNKIETLLNEKLELVKERVPDIEKEVFKAPSVKEVQQVARESMDDDNLLNEALQLAKNQGVDVNTTPEQIKKYVQNPKLMENVDEKVKMWYATFLRGIYKKLKKDLKYIKDSQVFTPQGRKTSEGGISYNQKKKIIKALNLYNKLLETRKPYSALRKVANKNGWRISTCKKNLTKARKLQK